MGRPHLLREHSLYPLESQEPSHWRILRRLKLVHVVNGDKASVKLAFFYAHFSFQKSFLWGLFLEIINSNFKIDRFIRSQGRHHVGSKSWHAAGYQTYSWLNTVILFVKDLIVDNHWLLIRKLISETKIKSGKYFYEVEIYVV